MVVLLILNNILYLMVACPHFSYLQEHLFQGRYAYTIAQHLEAR